MLCCRGRPPNGIKVCQNEVVIDLSEEPIRGTAYPTWNGYVKACLSAALNRAGIAGGHLV